MKSKHLLFITFTLFICTVSAQSDAEALIKKSIAYHDPFNKMESSKISFYFTETRPNGPDRQSKVMMYPKKEQFSMQKNIDGETTYTSIKKGNIRHTVNKKAPNKEQIEKYRMTEERTIMMRNYYHYLWYLPTKLGDPGSIIHPEVKETDFFGADALEIKVTYTPEVGDDIWYFYFHPMSAALIGYRFYHNEEDNDGEYIILKEETQFKSVRLPKRRTWYTHKENKLLGTDILDKLRLH